MKKDSNDVAPSSLGKEDSYSDSRLQAILENAVDAILTIDPKGCIESCNPSAFRMFGYSSEEMIGRNIKMLMPSPYRGEHDEYLINYLTTSEKKIIGIGREVIGLRKDGTSFPMELAVSEVKQNGLHSFTGIIRDISERKQTDELRIAKEQTDRANEAKSEFLANMSHEIRTPLTAILGFSEVLSENLSNPDDIEAIQTIQRNGKHLLKLINDILDLSKIEAEKLDFECIDVPLCQLVIEIISLMRVQADEKGLSLEVGFSTRIPKSIQSDPTRIRQIVINLISNAIKFTDAGEVRLRVCLLDENGSTPKIQFEVIDCGIGIEEEAIEKLFTPFSQADSSTTRRFGGTGLGLTISSRLAKLLGGEVVVKSVLGKGSVFTATIATGSLEAVTMLENLSEAALKSQQTSKTSPQNNSNLNCRILLAEDGVDNQRLISFVLNRAGAEVTLAENGQIAVDFALKASAEGSPYDVILMDMQMPVLDGYDAARHLRNEGYSGPIIALTAHAMATDRQKCIDAGCNDYATKPIDRKKLIELVGRYASRN